MEEILKIIHKETEMFEPTRNLDGDNTLLIEGVDGIHTDRLESLPENPNEEEKDARDHIAEAQAEIEKTDKLLERALQQQNQSIGHSYESDEG